MTRDEFLAYMMQAHEKMIGIVERKNHDYTGSEDPFANFEACELLGICSAEAGILVRRVDKLKRVITFVQKGVLKVTDEQVEDTLLDDANYSLILAALIHSKRLKALQKAPVANAFKISCLQNEHRGMPVELEKRGNVWVVRLVDGSLQWAHHTIKGLREQFESCYGITEGWPVE